MVPKSVLLTLCSALYTLSVASRYEQGWGKKLTFVFGVTPFPYKVITIASGVTRLDLLTFLIASLAARGLRFFIVATLLWYFGEPIRAFIERYLGPLFILFVICLIGGFVAVRFLL